MRAVCLAIACALAACTATATEPTAPDPAPAIVQITDENGTEIMPVRLIEPTPDMLKAALDNDPDAMRDAALSLTGCQAASTCPAEFGSCSSWSAPALCAQTCGLPLCRCTPIWAPHCEGTSPEPRGTDSYNAFRVCFNAGGQSCTEWQATSSSYCGC